jgi:hypothetical protein
MNYQAKPSVHGCLVFIGCTLFFPIGVFFLLFRIYKHRHANHLKIDDIKLISVSLMVVWAFMSFVYMVAMVQEHPGDVVLFAAITFLFLALPGVLLGLWARRKERKLHQMYTYYENLTVHKHIASIDRIADMTKQNAHTVMNDICHMIYTGRLPGAFVDSYSREVLFRNAHADPHRHDVNIVIETGYSRMQAAPAAAPVKKEAVPAVKVVECSGCGYKTELVQGQSKECEYCGSPVG